MIKSGAREYALLLRSWYEYPHHEREEMYSRSRPACRSGSPCIRHAITHLPARPEALVGRAEHAISAVGLPYSPLPSSSRQRSHSPSGSATSSSPAAVRRECIPAATSRVSSSTSRERSCVVERYTGRQDDKSVVGLVWVDRFIAIGIGIHPKRSCS